MEAKNPLEGKVRIRPFKAKPLIRNPQTGERLEQGRVITVPKNLYWLRRLKYEDVEEVKLWHIKAVEPVEKQKAKNEKRGN